MNKPLKDLGFDPVAMKRLLEEFGASIKVKDEGGALVDLLSEHLVSGLPGGIGAKVTTDNYDKVSGPGQTFEKVTGVHDKTAKMGDGSLIKPGDESVVIKGITEADLVKLFEKSQDILKGKTISIVKN